MPRFFGSFGRLAFLVVWIGGLAGAAAASRPFLSWSQKADVLWTGTVTDTSGNEYNIRIMPGYKNAFGFGTGSWGDGWSQQVSGARWIYSGLKDAPRSLARLKEYATAEPWHGIADGWDDGTDVVVWAATEMMTKGAAKDWREYWANAHRAQERESFGWWLAYPWAMVKGTVNTAVRQVIGVLAMGAGVSWALVLRPAYQLVKPVVLVGWDLGWAAGEAGWGVVKGAWGLGVNQLLLGTATPIAGWAWNTALGLPLALIGKVPSPKSVDGWWISQVSGTRYTGPLDGPSQTLAWDGVDPLSDSAKLEVWFKERIMRVRRAQAKDSVTKVYAPGLAAIERQLDSLRKGADSLRRRAREDKELAVARFPSQGDDPRDWSRCRGDGSQVLGDSVHLAVRANLLRYLEGTPLADSLADRIEDEFRRTWGRCYQNRNLPIEDIDPNAKFNPNHLVKDEVRQILK